MKWTEEVERHIRALMAADRLGCTAGWYAATIDVLLESLDQSRARVAKLERVAETLRWVEEGEGWAWSDKTAQRVNDILAALEASNE